MWRRQALWPSGSWANEMYEKSTLSGAFSLFLFTDFCPRGKGEGPDAAGKHHHQEVPQAVSQKIIGEQGMEGCLHTGLDGQQQAEAQYQLEELAGEGRFGVQRLSAS